MTGRRIEFGNMNAILNESLSGIEIVKSSALELESIEKYQESAISYKTFGIKSGYVRAKFYPLLYIGIVITLGLIYSIFLYNNAILSLGQVIGYLGVLGRLRLPTNMSNHAFFMIQRAKAGADRLVETMNTKSEITELQDSITHQIEGKVEFKGVSFNYPGTKNKVLKNISFQIQPGQVIAIVGTTGSGKTTLTKLISRLYDISEGQILIDGIDVREYSLNSLRDQISYIEQDVFLFSKSVNENIAFGKYSFSKAKIKEVAKEAQAHDFIMNLPNQYETEVGERGVKLSGGEKQRIAIARAFLSDPKILVLDDASSAIDSKTEEKIQKAILKVLSNRTTLLITHRLSQIRWADLILVLKRGEIVARGTHNELLQSSEEYREIFIRKFDKTLNELLKTDLKKTEMREN
jgi:ATP-binding cassette subfamily B protein